MGNWWEEPAVDTTPLTTAEVQAQRAQLALELTALFHSALPTEAGAEVRRWAAVALWVNTRLVAALAEEGGDAPGHDTLS